MQTVSACIIAKNEESMIRRCLDSIKWCDEIILVDTGSTDKTMEIAKEYGAKIYEHPWQNDFSLHRNQSIEYATGDWICIIDCDEEFNCDMTRFKERLDKVAPGIGGLVVRVNEVGGDRVTSWLGIRFFRKSSGVHYKGIVHNKAVYSGGCAGTDIIMNHYGYSLSPEKMKAKRARTEALLQKRISENPEDHAAFYYMTQLRIGEKNYEDAIRYGLQFFKTVPIGPDEFQFYSVMYFWMAWSYLHLGDGGSAVAWALKGLDFFPTDIDLCYVMARIGHQAQRSEWVAAYGKRFIELYEKRSSPQHEDGGFVQAVDADQWQNRTVYCQGEETLAQVKSFMGEAL